MHVREVKKTFKVNGKVLVLQMYQGVFGLYSSYSNVMNKEM